MRNGVERIWAFRAHRYHLELNWAGYRKCTQRVWLLVTGNAHSVSDCWLQEMHTACPTAGYRKYTQRVWLLVTGNAHSVSDCWLQEVHTACLTAGYRKCTQLVRLLVPENAHNLSHCCSALVKEIKRGKNLSEPHFSCAQHAWKTSCAKTLLVYTANTEADTNPRWLMILLQAPRQTRANKRSVTRIPEWKLGRTGITRASIWII